MAEPLRLRAAAELGSVLRAVAKGRAIPETVAKKFETAIRAVSTAIAKSKLFDEVGAPGANDPDAEQCLRLSPPFDPANASHAHDWAQQVEDHYNAFVADAQRRGLEARYDCALEIDSWHILQPLRPFGGAGNWR